MIQPPLGTAFVGAHYAKDFETLFVTARLYPAHKLYPASWFCSILGALAGHARVAIFCFVVPKWCPTLQKHAVTAYAALSTEFEKTPISCGFAGYTYETLCRLMAHKIAILAIKNSRPNFGELTAIFY